MFQYKYVPYIVYVNSKPHIFCTLYSTFVQRLLVILVILDVCQKFPHRFDLTFSSGPGSIHPEVLFDFRPIYQKHGAVPPRLITKENEILIIMGTNPRLGTTFEENLIDIVVHSVLEGSTTTYSVITCPNQNLGRVKLGRF